MERFKSLAFLIRAQTHQKQSSLTLIGMRQGGFTPLIIFRLDFVSLIFFKNFQTFLEVKIGVNRDNLTPCQAY